MTLREIITKALKRINVSQPNSQMLDKGKDAVERFIIDMQNDPTLNTFNPIVAFSELTGTAGSVVVNDAYTTTITANGLDAMLGLIDNDKVLTQVDIKTWYKNKDGEEYYALGQYEDGSVKVYHKFKDLAGAKLIERYRVSYNLDDELNMPKELTNLCQLYICKDLARSNEQYLRFSTEYDKEETKIKDNRITFVLPTRDTGDYWYGR